MNQLRPFLKSYLLQLTKETIQKRLGCLQISSISQSPPSYILSDQKHRIKAYLTPAAIEAFDKSYGTVSAWSTKRGALIKLDAFQLQYDNEKFFFILDAWSVLGAEESNEFGAPIDIMEDMEILQVFHQMIRIDPQQNKLVLSEYTELELQAVNEDQNRLLNQMQIWHPRIFSNQKSNSEDFEPGTQDEKHPEKSTKFLSFHFC